MSWCTAWSRKCTVCQIRKKLRANLQDKSVIALSLDDNRSRVNRLMQICKGSMPHRCCITQWQAKHERTTYSVSRCSLPTTLMTQLSRWVPIDVYSGHILICLIAELHIEPKGPPVVKTTQPGLWWRWAAIHPGSTKWIVTLEPQLCCGIQNTSSQLYYLRHSQGAQLLMIQLPFLPCDILKGRSIWPTPLLVLSITQSIQHQSPLLSRWCQPFKGDIRHPLGPLARNWS